MMFLQTQLEPLRLQLERWKIVLTPPQMMQLAVGLTVVFLLYGLIKTWQFFRRRVRPSVPAPKMRPRAATSVKRAVSASAEELSVSATAGSQASVVPPDVSRSSASLLAAPTSGRQESEPDLPPTDSMTPRPTDSKGPIRFWPVEPRTVEKKNPFEQSGEEYPWADGSDYTFGSTTPILSEMLPTTESGRRSLSRTLRNAGYYSPHALQNLSAIRYLGIVLPIVLCGALMIVVPEQWELSAVAGLVIGPIIGWALPTLYVRSRAAERLREIENAMPDMLDLLNMCVSQGMTVASSMRRVGKEISPVYPALSRELSIVAEQARIGHLTEAIANFSERVDTPEVHSFASLMIQTEQMGTSVSDALSDYSDSMREGQKQRADEKANAATFKLLFPTVLCLMPAVFLFLMGPSLIELNRFFSNGGLEGLDQGATQAIERQSNQP